MLLQNTKALFAVTFTSSSRSCSHPQICHASSLFSFLFSYFTFWFSPHVNILRKFKIRWEVKVFIFTLYPHMVMWPNEKTSIRSYGLKLWIDGLEASFHSSDSSHRKWLPLFCCQINVHICYWFFFFEIIDYHYYYWLID